MLGNKSKTDNKFMTDSKPVEDSTVTGPNRAATDRQINSNKSVRIPPVRPVDEDCSTDTVPSTDKREKSGTGEQQPQESEKHEVLIPILNSMTKVLFDRYRLHMYTYLNRLLSNGTLSRLVGRKVLNDRIRANVCNFKNVSYWRINRENFYAVVDVNLKLTTASGPIDWMGYLLCWCSFENKLVVTMEDLTADPDMASEGLELLDRYLVPYSTNQPVDRVAEEMWAKYIPEALEDPDSRDAAELASRMGLSIQYRPVYDHKHRANSILFLIEDTLEVGEDRYVKIDEDRSAETGKGRSAEVDEDYFAENGYNETGYMESGEDSIDKATVLCCR